MTNFKIIDYLKSGSLIQQLAYHELKVLAIFEKLKIYNPILAGTIPIRINIPGSDLDILCQCSNHTEFSNYISNVFGNQPNFEIYHKIFEDIPSTIARFNGKYFEIEIFGQNIFTEKQNAYRHMIIENKMLIKKGELFRQEIINLKKSGIKTEASFTKLLGLKGNPYRALLKLE